MGEAPPDRISLTTNRSTICAPRGRRQPATLHAEHRTALPEWLGVVTGEASQCSRPSDPTGKRAGNRKRYDPQRRTAARLVMSYIRYRNWKISNNRYNHGQVSSRRSRSLLPGARSPGDDRWRKAQAIGLRRQDAVAGSRGVFLLRSRGIADALGRRFTGRTGGVPRQFRFSHYPGNRLSQQRPRRPVAASVFRLLVGRALSRSACSVRTWGEQARNQGFSQGDWANAWWPA